MPLWIGLEYLEPLRELVLPCLVEQLLIKLSEVVDRFGHHTTVCRALSNEVLNVGILVIRLSRLRLVESPPNLLALEVVPILRL